MLYPFERARLPANRIKLKHSYMLPRSESRKPCIASSPSRFFRGAALFLPPAFLATGSGIGAAGPSGWFYAIRDGAKKTPDVCS